MTEPTQKPPATRFRRTFAQHSLTLFAVLGFVKLLLALERHGFALFSHPPRLSEWLFRDVLIALLWGLVAEGAAALSGHKNRLVNGALRATIVLFALYTGLNIGFFRSFSTPLNRGMMGMAGGMGDLRESAVMFVTVANVWPILVALLLAATLPALIERTKNRLRLGLDIVSYGLMLTIVALALFGPSGGDARGLDRNALWELALLGVPEAENTPENVGSDERIAQPLTRGSLAEPGAPGPDLAHLRAAAKDMNLVYIVLESTSAEYLGLYGAERDPMPSVTRIAENALVLDSWYTVTPASMKSMFATFCATYPYPRPTAMTYVRPDLPCHSMPEILSLNGYRSTLVHSGKFSYTRKDLFLESRGFESLWDMRTLPHDDDAWSDAWGIEEEVALAQMVRFLDDVQDDKFFLAYFPIFPHYPYHLPDDEEPTFGDASAKQRYLSAMAYSDRTVGALYDALAARDLLDNTLIVIVGDHGEAFRQHPGNSIHSTSIYEENVHVPALLSNPVLFPGTTRLDAPGDHTTMGPTLFEMLDIPVPDRWQGHSLLDGERHMARFFTDYSFLYLGLRDGPYKFIYQVQTGNTQLFDLSQDPGEDRDISADFPELVQQYSAHLDHWYVRQLALFSDYEAFVAGTLVDSGVALLQDLVPIHVEHGSKKTRFGVSINHKPLIVAGNHYDTGISQHSDALIRYEIDGKYRQITGFVGRNTAARNGTVVGEIWVDDTRVFESGALERRSAAVPFTLDLQGAQVLEFRALDGDDGKRGDHLDWVDVTLQ